MRRNRNERINNYAATRQRFVDAGIIHDVPPTITQQSNKSFYRFLEFLQRIRLFILHYTHYAFGIPHLIVGWLGFIYIAARHEKRCPTPSQQCLAGGLLILLLTQLAFLYLFLGIMRFIFEHHVYAPKAALSDFRWYCGVLLFVPRKLIEGLFKVIGAVCCCGLCRGK